MGLRGLMMRGGMRGRVMIGDERRKYGRDLWELGAEEELASSMGD